VYLDAFRNAFAQTIVAPYSVRRRPGAPVSTPLDWSEVNGKLDPGAFNAGSFAHRLREPDPWAGFFRARQSLRRARAALAAQVEAR
jgi:bifunctional non-homologous end joining protein LigD